jgi:hypothetical protein
VPSSRQASELSRTLTFDCNGESLHRNNVMMNCRFDQGYKLPTVRSNLAGWKFIYCSGSPNGYVPGATVGFPDGMS